VTRQGAKLTSEQAIALCRAFATLPNLASNIEDRLGSINFSAWRPYCKFLESFGTEEEVRIHRTCVIEEARTRLSTPYPWHLTDTERAQIYQSPFLDGLRVERDRANGVPEKDLSKRYDWGGERAWRREIDPCKRKQVYASVNHPDDYGAIWHEMLDEQRRWFESEVVVHATQISRRHTFDNAGRIALFKEAMAQYAGPLDFILDKRWSRPTCPVFSKKISANWNLALILDQPHMLTLTPFEGHATLILILVRSDVKKLGKSQVGDGIAIRYSLVILWFGNAYWQFYCQDELETIVKAYVCLYGMVAPVIEAACASILD